MTRVSRADPFAQGQLDGLYDLSRLSVLVVDDSGFMIGTVRALLESMGIHSITSRNSAANLVEQLPELDPDIIITDHIMEPVSGLELIRRIRREAVGRFRFVPVILLTGYADHQVVVRARFEAGADAVLVKPVSAQRLFSCLVAVYESDRRFVETKSYLGPDRRVKDRPFEGPNRRGAALPTANDDNPDELVFVDAASGETAQGNGQSKPSQPAARKG